MRASCCHAAGCYTCRSADALPNLPVYLRTKYGHLPAGARKELADIVARLEARAWLGHAPLDQANK